MQAGSHGSGVAAPREELPDALGRGRGSFVPRPEVVGADGCGRAGRDRGGDGILAGGDASSLGITGVQEEATQISQSAQVSQKLQGASALFLKRTISLFLQRLLRPVCVISVPERMRRL